MVGAVTAAVAAVGSLGLAAYSMSQQQGVADQQLGMMNSQLDLEKNLFGQQQQYRDQLSTLMNDPSSVTKLPGYQFNKQQGEESVARQFAGNPGGGGSAALMRYGQDYASGAYGQQVQLLAQLSGISQNPASYGSVGVGAGGNAVSSSANSFDSMMRVLSEGGSVAKLFGPKGAFGAAGTPTNPGTPGAGMGPGGMQPTGWFDSAPAVQ